MRLVVAALCAGAVVLGACSSGAASRGTTSLAVKAALKSNNVDYRGDVTCRGTQLPINCTSTTTDGRPIHATLSKSGQNCLLVVTAGNEQVSRNTGPCP